MFLKMAGRLNQTGSINEKPQLNGVGGALEEYRDRISKIPILSREEERRIADEFYETRNPALAKRLVEANLRYVLQETFKYSNYTIDFMDLIQEGNLGLMRAVEKFEPQRGYKLISYATWWIRAYMQNYLLKSMSELKFKTGRNHGNLAVHVTSGKKQSERRREALETGVSEEEILSRDTGEKIEDINRAKVLLNGGVSSLDAPIKGAEGEVHTLSDVIPGEGDDPEDLVHRRELMTRLREQMRRVLTPKEELVLTQRFLTPQKTVFKKLGEQLGMSRMGTQFVEVRALSKMRDALPEHFRGWLAD